MGILDGKVAVITGAGGGIGKAHALSFAKEGAKIVVNDLGGTRDGQGKGSAMADLVVDEIKKMGGKAVANYDSVATIEGGKNITKTALDAFGGLDIVVNNAGILRDKTLMKMTEAEWDLVIQVHLKGTFAVTQPAFAHMKESGKGGRIINTSSFSGLLGNFGQTNYAAAKAGIYGFTRVVALEGQKYGITCNAIAPVAKTRMTEDLAMFGSVGDELDPKYISPIVLFLASDLSKEVTGKIFGVQGGKLFAYFMKVSEGIMKEKDGGLWTVNEIAKDLTGILSAENA